MCKLDFQKHLFYAAAKRQQEGYTMIDLNKYLTDKNMKSSDWYIDLVTNDQKLIFYTDLSEFDSYNADSSIVPVSSNEVITFKTGCISITLDKINNLICISGIKGITVDGEKVDAAQINYLC